MAKVWFVYILRCKDGTFYTGISNDVKARVRTHNLGKGAKYTKTRRPVKLLYSKRYKDQGTAMKRERLLKTWPRDKKRKLIKGLIK